jgi:hypothetical protein
MHRATDQQVVHLVDGGYYDNSGLTSALELKRSIEVASHDLGLADKLTVKIIILASDLTPSKTERSLNELLDPIRTVLHSWRTRPRDLIEQTVLALNSATESPPVVYVVHLRGALYDLPLGWRLAGGTIDLINSEDPVPNVCDEHETVESKGNLFEADCLLSGIARELL